MKYYIMSFFLSFTKKTVLLSTIILAISFDWLKLAIKEYIWDDYKYVGFLAVIILVDTITGVMASRWGRKEPITSKKMQGMIIKIILYVCYLISIHVALNFKIDGEVAKVFDFLKTILYTYPIVRELLSIDENMDVLGYSIFPKVLREKLRDFGNKEEITSTNNQGDN